MADRDGGPLGTVSGLTGGLGDTFGGVTGGLGGLTSILGGREGLNLIGLVGIGSDDPALLDLNPAEKKAKKIEKMELAEQRDKQRKEA